MSCKLTNPCGKDCKERSATCHSVCEKYLAYEKAYMESINRQDWEADNMYVTGKPKRYKKMKERAEK